MAKKDYRVSAVVPAYNEQKTIYRVLSALKKSPRIDEIICINDGSTDNTVKQIKRIKGLTFINLKKNHGKGYAVARGVYKAQGDIIVFLDADLHNLSEHLIEQITTPLLTNQYRVAIGYPSYYSFDRLFKPLSGQRAYFKKDLLPYLGKLEKKGYGIELYLNHIFRKSKIKIFALDGMKYSLKIEKQLSWDAIAKLQIVQISDVFHEIMKNKNPLVYLIDAYFINFYFSKKKDRDLQFKKVVAYIKKQVNKTSLSA